MTSGLHLAPPAVGQRRRCSVTCSERINWTLAGIIIQVGRLRLAVALAVLLHFPTQFTLSFNLESPIIPNSTPALQHSPAPPSHCCLLVSTRFLVVEFDTRLLSPRTPTVTKFCITSAFRPSPHQALTSPCVFDDSPVLTRGLRPS